MYAEKREGYWMIEKGYGITKYFWWGTEHGIGGSVAGNTPSVPIVLL